MAWSPTYCTGSALEDWLGIYDDPQLDLCAEATSRAIDKACNRQFGQTSSTEFRWYTAEFYRDRWLIEIDDLMTDASLTVEVDNDGDGTTEAEITDYRLTPINAAPVGRPWTRIEVLPSSAVQPNGIQHGVRVSAQWGWTNVPNPVKVACQIQASRLYERRENIAGPLTVKEVDDVRLGWAASGAVELDPDVLASVAPYRRLWAAV